LLRLLPRVREDADGARQAEEAACQRRRKAELRVDHGSRSVDVHRNATAILALERRLDRAADPGELAGYRACPCGRIDELEQPRGAGIERVEPMAVARNDLAMRRDKGSEAGVDGRRLGCARFDSLLDVQEQVD